ncbi:gp53-like domain-containing protein [Sphingomonas sp. RS6]
MPFTLTVTNAGRAALVNAANNGTNAVLITQAGVSATAVAPAPTLTALPGEIKRIGTIAGEAVAADTIHVTIRDESNAVYTVRSIALYLADGTLFGVYGQADVLVEKSSQAMLLLAIDVRFADIAAASLTFGDTNFLNPPATSETVGVVELATEAESSAGTDDRRAVTPKGLSFAMTARLAGFGADLWRASNDGAGSGLDADLLDGQQGSWYTDIAARLGYTPANRAGDTFTGPIRRDSQFYLDFADGNPAIVWGSDAGGVDRIEFDRANNSWLFKVAGGGAAGISTAGITRAGARVWDATNDGSGSGLDADLLDGRHASEFALGASLNDVWRSSNDGSGSGLDADLLDGHDGGYYADIRARLGFWPVRQGTGIGQGSNVVHIGWSGSRLKATVDNLDLGNVVFDEHLSDVWRSSNDGAGSGLDADLLDGRQASEFALTASLSNVWRSVNDGAGSGLDADLLDGRQASEFPLRSDFDCSLGENGYQRLPSGLIEQWGKVRATWLTETVVDIDFPIPFPNACLSVTATGFISSSNNNRDLWPQICGEPTQYGVRIQLQSDDSSDRQLNGINWTAKGY